MTHRHCLSLTVQLCNATIKTARKNEVPIVPLMIDASLVCPKLTNLPPPSPICRCWGTCDNGYIWGCWLMYILSLNKYMKIWPLIVFKICLIIFVFKLKIKIHRLSASKIINGGTAGDYEACLCAVGNLLSACNSTLTPCVNVMSRDVSSLDATTSVHHWLSTVLPGFCLPCAYCHRKHC